MIKIEKFIPGGQALATDENGKKLFFWGALPDEIILDYIVTKNKSHYTEAIATEIENPSRHRISPKDACYLSTSPWQIMNYDYELETKRALVVEIFREHQILIHLPKIFTDGKEYFYRNKMEYALYWNNDTGKIEPAFHVRGSHRKVPITNSSIEHPEIYESALNIIADLNNRGEEARKYQSLLLRASQDGNVSGGLYENGQPHPIFDNLTDTILGRNYSYSPNGFFQINLPVYELALTEIKKHITTDDVLDLYAGVGTIGLSVAPEKNLTLVECNESAYNEMVRNTTISENTSATGHFVRPILSKSEDALSYITHHHTVILDPPRAGCDTKLINKLLETTPPIIIYLSCNPATQARDVKALLEKYDIKTVKTYNFFPRTPHIENLVILEAKHA